MVDRGDYARADHGLTWGGFELRGDVLDVEGRTVKIVRGTPALLATAAVAARAPWASRRPALFAGDTGSGAGSRTLYAKLVNN